MYFLQILINSLINGTQVLLLAVPLFLVYQVGKIFHLAVGAIATACAYIFYAVYITGPGNIGTLGLAILAMLGGVIVGGVLSHLLLEGFIKRHQTLFALLISFSSGVAIEAVLGMVFGTDGKSIIDGVLPTFHLGAVTITLPGLLTIVFGVVLALLTVFLLSYTPIGRKLRSLSESSVLTESLGIRASRLRLLTYVLAILLASIVIVLTGMHTALTPGMGFPILILAFMAFLIGGIHNIWGTIIAAYILALIPETIIAYSSFSESWKMVFVFIIAAILLSLRPNGLFTSSVRAS